MVAPTTDKVRHIATFDDAPMCPNQSTGHMHTGERLPAKASVGLGSVYLSRARVLGPSRAFCLFRGKHPTLRFQVKIYTNNAAIQPLVLAEDLVALELLCFQRSSSKLLPLSTLV